ncbi:hypothetical protein [Haloactinospora alba]|nr:hypothetical protein [Haloactinospora alba]
MSPQTRLARGRGKLRRKWRLPRIGRRDAERARALYRAQGARGAVSLGALFLLLFGMPGVFALWPELDHVRLWGVPVSWLMVGVVPFPVMAGLAWWQLRWAERTEERE